MKKFLIASAAAVLPALFGGVRAADNVQPWADPETNEINRLPAHADFFPFESVGKSALGKSASSNFLSLDGKWKFRWTRDRDGALADGFEKPVTPGANISPTIRPLFPPCITMSASIVAPFWFQPPGRGKTSSPGLARLRQT